MTAVLDRDREQAALLLRQRIPAIQRHVSAAKSSIEDRGLGVAIIAL